MVAVPLLRVLPAAVVPPVVVRRVLPARPARPARQAALRVASEAAGQQLDRRRPMQERLRQAVALRPVPVVVPLVVVRVPGQLAQAVPQAALLAGFNVNA